MMNLGVSQLNTSKTHRDRQVYERNAGSHNCNFAIEIVFPCDLPFLKDDSSVPGTNVFDICLRMISSGSELNDYVCG